MGPSGRKEEKRFKTVVCPAEMRRPSVGVATCANPRRGRRNLIGPARELDENKCCKISLLRPISLLLSLLFGLASAD